MKKENQEMKNHKENLHAHKTEEKNSVENPETKKSNDNHESDRENQSLNIKLEAELEQANAKAEQLEKELLDYKDKLLRRAAEFENYKRRTENDQLNLIKYSAESFIVKLLPIVDDFERSLQHIDNAKDIESLKQGIKLVYDKLIKVLNDQGVKTIDAVGKPFDVHFHEALLQQKADNVEPHTVINEVEKGYMYKDRVIRHSKVIVSEAPDEEATQAENSKHKNSSNDEDK